MNPPIMKQRLLMLCTLLYLPTHLTAQAANSANDIKLKQIYMEFGPAIATNFEHIHFAGDFGVDFMLTNAWGGMITIRGSEFPAPNIPADYHSGLHILGNGIPKNGVAIYTMAVTRTLSSPETPVSVNLSGGPTFVSYETSTFTGSSSGFLSSNYEQNITTNRSLGFTLQLTVNMPVSAGFGFNYNFYTTFYGNGVYCGTGFNFLFGYLKHPNPNRRPHHGPPPPPFMRKRTERTQEY